MTMLTPRLLVAMAVLGTVTVVVQCRPTSESEESEAEVEFSGPAPEPEIMYVPDSAWSDPNSPFGRMLAKHLSAMSVQDLSILESGLPGGSAISPSDETDRMMGDMPSMDESQDSSSPATAVRQPSASTDDYSDDLALIRQSPESADPEDRDKSLRLKNIQNTIINFMQMNPQVQSPSPIIKTSPTSAVPTPNSQERAAFRILYENVNNFPSYPSDMFTEKTQSFYPTCELPKHTSDEVWNTKETMNLMFNISLPKSSRGISVNVHMARLRLYKQYVPCYSQSSNETDDSQACEPVLLEETKLSNTNLSTAGVLPVIIEDKQIRVSIYAYTRSLKRKRVKRKLLDSRMLPYFSEKWTEWNIRNAVKAWHKTPVRNYGISVEVEDEDGNLLPVNQFFKPMNCTGDAQMMTPKPIPGFLMEAVHGYGVPIDHPSGASNNTALAFSFNSHRFPIVDITTVEMPESEAKNALLFQYTRNAFEQQFADRIALAATHMPPPQHGADAVTTEHRTRHGAGRQHRNNGTATLAGTLSKDGRELRDQIIVQRVIQRNAQHNKPLPTADPDSEQ